MSGRGPSGINRGSRRSERIKAGRANSEEQNQEQETSDHSRAKNLDGKEEDMSRKRKATEARTAQVREGKVAAKAVSKKSRSAGGRQEEDTGPREMRRGQHKLPRGRDLDLPPFDRGSRKPEKRDNPFAGGDKTESKWDQRGVKTYEEWVQEKQDQDSLRREKNATRPSAAKKRKAGGKGFTARDWAEAELTAVVKTILLSDSKDFCEELREFGKLKIAAKRSRVTLAFAGISSSLEKIFDTGDQLHQFFLQVVELSSMRDCLQNKDIQDCDEKFKEKYMRIKNATDPVLKSLQKARVGIQDEVYGQEIDMSSEQTGNIEDIGEASKSREVGDHSNKKVVQQRSRIRELMSKCGDGTDFEQLEELEMLAESNSEARNSLQSKRAVEDKDLGPNQKVKMMSYPKKRNFLSAEKAEEGTRSARMELFAMAIRQGSGGILKLLLIGSRRGSTSVSYTPIHTSSPSLNPEICLATLALIFVASPAAGSIIENLITSLDI